MRQYATTADLTAWLGGATPGNAGVLLRSASLLVEAATRNTVYDTTSDGLPTDAVLASALRDAVCAQAATWAALGVDPVKGPAGDTPAVASKQIGSATIAYAVSAVTAQARADAATTLCPASVTILRTAGLLSAAVGSW